MSKYETDMVFAQADDWVGVCIAGELVTEGHSISAFEAADIAIANRATSLEYMDVDLDWIHDEGNLPNRIEDVVWSSAAQVAEAA